MADIQQISKKVGEQFSENLPQEEAPITSASYQAFKKEQREEFSINTMYEKYCLFSEKFLGFIKLLGKDSEAGLREEIWIASINVTPQGVISSAFMTFLIAFIIAVPFLLLGSLSFSFFVVATGFFVGLILYTYPGYSAEITKIRAEQESLLAILYMTIYMRVNPILENAMYFAAEHLHGPLGKDLKQCLWLVDNEKVSSLEESIQYFIPLWVKRNSDFVRAVLTLHSVLDQKDKENQARILDKSLDQILESTYDKMKHYAHDLQMPVTVLHTFGMMLPLIGLIAFPMMSIFMADSVNISHLFFGYIVVLPMLLLFFTQRIIAKRPGAFSYPDITNNPYVPPQGTFRIKTKTNTFLIPVLMVALMVGFLVMIPGLYHMAFNTIPAYIENKEKASQLLPGQLPRALEKEYEVGSVLAVLTIPIGLALGIAIFFYGRSIQKLKIRDEIVEIERDLSGALFQLANQFTETIPIEQAVENFVNEYVLLNLKRKSIFNFFSAVIDRIQDEGVTFTQAIFERRNGVIVRYPSILLKEIVWIISEGARKGAEIVYNIVNKISIYLDNVKKIRDLIYDLLTETVQSINMQAKFLAPFIAAIVGSLSLVIIRALWEMAKRLDDIMNSLNFGTTGMSDSSFFSDFINFTKITPPTIFGTLVGIYLVETVVLLSLLANGVENGFDKVSRDVTIGKNMIMAITLYVIVTIIGTFALSHLIQSGSDLAS